MAAKRKDALIREIKRSLACLPDKNLEDAHIMVSLVAEGNTMIRAAISSLGTILKERNKLAADVAELRKIKASLDRKISDQKQKLTHHIERNAILVKDNEKLNAADRERRTRDSLVVNSEI